MRKIILLFVLFISFVAQAQEDAWVYFNDKPDAAVYFDNPLLMLSQRSLDRRIQQNIALDVKDVPVSNTYIDQVSTTSGITVLAKSKWLNALHVRGAFADVSALAGFPFVQSVQFANDALNSGQAGSPVALRPAQVSKQNQTMVNFTYGSSANQINMLNGHLLHQQDYTGTGKIIAVMDAGFPGVNIEQPFQRLLTNNLILGGYNFVDRNTNYYAGGTHGSLVLSTMGGYTETSIVGTAPDAYYYLFITEDISSENPLEESLWVEAAEAADSLGVDIINTSLGYFHYDNPNYSHSYSDMDGQTAFISRGADIAASKGMVVVVSAGNSGMTSDPNISAPADANGVLTVGAVDPSGQYAVFSSVGPSADGRIKPDVMAQGQSTVVSTATGSISTANGTSFSAPITAGMVACLWQALPTKTSVEIIQLIKESAHLYSSPNNLYGYGIPNYQQALINGLGISELGPPKLVVYPNPVANYMTFETSDANPCAGHLEIINALGQTVLSTSIRESGRVDTTGLSSGLYLYRIHTAGQSFSGKIIKQ